MCHKFLRVFRDLCHARKEGEEEPILPSGGGAESAITGMSQSSFFPYLISMFNLSFLCFAMNMRN